MPHVVSRIASLLPPAVRRASAGAWLDLRSFPARLADPARRRQPWQTFHNVGAGDYVQAGRENLQHLMAFAGLKPSDAVLDIGCGAGRMARAIVSYLDRESPYVGFDVSGRAVATCRRTISKGHPNASFFVADVSNAEYRRKGRVDETAYRFPVEDRSFDVAFATSVFTHMGRPAIENYIAEAARVLKPGGRLMFTAFVLTPERVAAMENGAGRHPFRPWREGSMVVDPRSPERAIAHPAHAFLHAVEATGLAASQGIRFGSWLGPQGYAGGQDLIVAQKPR